MNSRFVSRSQSAWNNQISRQHSQESEDCYARSKVISGIYESNRFSGKEKIGEGAYGVVVRAYDKKRKVVSVLN